MIITVKDSSTSQRGYSRVKGIVDIDKTCLTLSRSSPVDITLLTQPQPDHEFEYDRNFYIHKICNTYC